MDNTFFNLELSFDERFIEIKIVNKSNEPLKIWDMNNSWGWGTIGLWFQTNDKQFLLLQKTTKMFTRNGPAPITIPPEDSHSFIFLKKDNVWEDINSLFSLKKKEFYVKAALVIPYSVEAKKQNVFIGELQSNLIKSDIPHSWVF